MHVRVNEKPIEIPDGATVGTLLELLRIEPGRVAVVVNTGIVPREEYPTRGLAEGDSVDLISFVGGG